MSNRLLISTMTYPMIDSCNNDEAYLDERFAFLKACGIEAIEFDDDYEDPVKLKKGEILHFWDKSLDELYAFFTPVKNAAARHGIAFSQFHALFPFYVEGNEEVTEYTRMAAEKTLAVAAFLGCPAVVVHPFSSLDKEEEWEVNLALYRRLIPTAKKYGVKICLENLTLSFNGRPVEGACSTADDACRYIDTLNEEAGADVFGFCLDIGHATIMRRNIKTFITKLGSRLTCLHIHDNDGTYDTHAMPFTHASGGTRAPSTDWNGMLAGLRQIDYQGNLSFESFKTFLLFPEALHEDLLKMYVGIGRYFREQILNG